MAVLIRLLITMFALMLAGTALANESNGDAEARPAAGVTLTCSVGTSGSAVCFVERPVFAVGSFELAVGIDTRVVFRGAGEGHVTGYAILGVYEPAWNVWLELAVPSVVPPFGKNDFARFGFTFRF